MAPLEAGAEAFPQTFSIVGIGASAGGLEACSALLKHIPPDTGLAFVVVQHLDPKHESLLPTLLARFAKIPVKPVQDAMAVAPNQVYVMPPNTEMVFSDGVLHLIPREKTPAGARLPIDGFFRSLAANCRHRAIGVVLSGTGSDGALGLEAIKAEGGFTFAQDTQSAKFEGMPHSAFATGSVDFVLPPAEIARELIKIAKYPYAERVDGVAKDGDAPSGQDPLPGILAFLHEASGVDFSQYRSSTIQRRVLRRMAIHHIAGAESYRRFLQETPGEVRLLCEEMIPKVTRFFRDPEVFAALQAQVFPQFLTNRAGDAPVRIWVPGCASGEEVYAIAICLLEFFKQNNAHFPIQIFGTDLSAIAIQKARQGLYLDKIAEDVSPERLQRFFEKNEEGYRIASSVREMCIFAAHDLIGDPPYSKLDLISCRNVLIYLDNVQTRVVPMFHYALKPTGFLLLGIMESAKRYSDLFAPLDKNSQIYAKLPAANRQWQNWAPAKALPPALFRPPVDSWDDAEVQKRADRAVLARYAPGGVVVNENWQVLQVRGKIAPYLEPASGKMSVNVLAMATRSGLAADLEAALQKAKNENAPVRAENLAIPHENLVVNLQVVPVDLARESRAFLVLFEEVPQAEFAVPEGREKESPVSQDEFVKLRDELAATRERLAALLDRYHQYADGAQTLQEESLSNLEEVQSINEELETAKEELQSTNEELSTVNDELQTRNSDLQRSRDFTNAIVETVRQPLVVLDKALCVKMANRSFYQTFLVAQRDTEGQFVYDVAHGVWNTPALRSALDRVLPNGRGFEDFEMEGDFPRAGRKSLCVDARPLDGGETMLMAIEDVTSRRRVEAELRIVHDQMRQVQKMEAMGRLAGGVAHDFNNLLTGILGFSDLLMGSVGEGTEAWQQADEIRKAGRRAADLTHQLLAFSRRQVLRPRVIDLNAVIRDLDKMLHRLMGDDIALAIEIEDTLWPTLADPGQLGQVILNLALNARDAMPHGGTLIVRTENVVVEEAGDRIRGLAPGDYVGLTVADSGVGMNPETQLHVFEPFYTTKPQGSGTGLGLATVFGIVEQSGGRIHFTSELDRGTTFWIDFPRAETPSAAVAPHGRAPLPRGEETVLVVEDEDMVRRLAVSVLRRQGCTVLEAGRGDEGLALCQSHPAKIDLLLSDVVMPGGMNGRQLAEQAVAIRPEMRVILMSGHTTDALVHYGVKKGAPFLQKPFTLQDLARGVREVLDGGGAGSE